MRASVSPSVRYVTSNISPVDLLNEWRYFNETDQHDTDDTEKVTGSKVKVGQLWL